MPISVNCNLCGANETEFVTNKVRYDTKDSIVKCKKCGLVYMNPQPSEKELREYYSKKYRDVYSSNKSPKETFEDTLPEANWRVNFLGNYFPKPKKVLDIGCSTGSFLYLLQKKGWEAYGTELHEDYTKFAKKKIGQNIYTGTLNDANFKDNQFDAVTLFHVLEHFSDPFSSLIEIKRVLKKDGLLYLEVPNVNNIKIKVDKKFASGFFQPAHNYYFSIKTLKDMLKKVGFEIIEIKSVRSERTYKGSSIKGCIKALISFIVGKLNMRSNILCVAKG